MPCSKTSRPNRRLPGNLADVPGLTLSGLACPYPGLSLSGLCLLPSGALLAALARTGCWVDLGMGLIWGPA